MDAELVGRVRRALEDARLSQSQIADRIGLSPDKLSKSLNSKRDFSSFELAAIASETGTTVDWLLTGAAAETPALAARSYSSTSIDATSAVDFLRRLDAADDQLGRLAENGRALPPTPQGIAYSEMADWATQTLSAAGLAVDGAENTDLIEALSIAFGVDVAITRDLPSGLDGCAWQTSSSRLIALAATPYWARQRFTLAHELGHILFCDAQDLIAESVDQRSADRTEKRANRFAAEFLMPEGLLRGAIGQESVARQDFAELAVRLYVSPLALSWRLFNLSLIDDREQKSWGSLTAEQAAMLVDQPRFVQQSRACAETTRLPSRLVEGHLSAYWNGLTSARPLAALLGVEVQEVLDLMPTPNASGD